MRKDGRLADRIRPFKLIRNYIRTAEGSVLVECGETRVICTASLEDKVPPHLKGTGTGWLTAEYSMLPRSVKVRSPRERMKIRGRTQEIQRLIGRALRTVVDLSLMGDKTVIVDCDVIQADGGTRTASVNGAFVALVDAFRSWKKAGRIQKFPVTDYLGAVSCGIVEGKAVLDLAYEEDRMASVDMNLVMTGSGRFVEVQATGEEATFSQQDLETLVDLARRGIEEIIGVQKEVLGGL